MPTALSNDDNAAAAVGNIPDSTVLKRQSRATRRPRPEPPQMDIDFSIPSSFRAKLPRAWLVRVSVRALLIHVLYVRGAVPTPVLEILRVYEQATTKISREQRSMIKCGGVLQRLLHQWDEIMNSDFAQHIDAVLVSLGQSWSRPREQYVLQFNGLGQDSETDQKVVPTDQQAHTLMRRLVSTIMNSTNGCEDQNVADWMVKPALGASSYQVQLSFWVSKPTAEQIFQGNTPVMVRHDFFLNQPTRNKPALIQTRMGVAATDEWNEASGIWMTLPTTVKGFRLTRR